MILILGLFWSRQLWGLLSSDGYFSFADCHIFHFFRWVDIGDLQWSSYVNMLGRLPGFLIWIWQMTFYRQQFQSYFGERRSFIYIKSSLKLLKDLLACWKMVCWMDYWSLMWILWESVCTILFDSTLINWYQSPCPYQWTGVDCYDQNLYQ